MKIIIWYGIRRSGNHGLIQLIINSIDYKYIFNNNITLSYDDYLMGCNENSRFNGYKNIKLLLLSIENKHIDFDEINKFSKNKEYELEKVLIIRNPYNMLASNYMFFKKNIEYINEIIELWIEYAIFILDDKHDFLIIFYDKFYNDENYRKNIGKKLDIQFDYSKINFRENFALSSFKETETNEFNRYNHFIDDELFNSIVIKNKKLHFYYKQLCEFFNYVDEEFNKL